MGAYGYLEKRPRLKKPRTANTTMTMMMIQRIDTWSLRRGFADSRFPVGSSATYARLGGERNGPRPGQRQGQAGEHREVGVKRDLRKPANP
jgi:hypothetical protein